METMANTGPQGRKSMTPAVSLYAPAPRNSLLRTSSPQKSKHGYGYASGGVAAVCLLLRFWNSPILQRALTQVGQAWCSWNGDEAARRLTNSKIGRVVRDKGKDLSLVLVRVVIQALRRLRLADTIVTIPPLLDQWVRAQHITDDTHNSNGNSDRDGPAGEAAEMRKCAREIDEVLMYWFGQYTPEVSQKKLWMIASSSTQQLHNTDADIAAKFRGMLQKLSSTADTRTRDAWCGEVQVHGWRGKLAALIVLDQMSRHIHRHDLRNNDSASPIKDTISSSIPNQLTLDKLALIISQEFLKEHAKEISCGMVPIPMLIFSLMPLRHASTIDTLAQVQAHIEKLTSLHSIDFEHIIRRFRRATNRRMAILQDQARRDGRPTTANHHVNDDTQCLLQPLLDPNIHSEDKKEDMEDMHNKPISLISHPPHNHDDIQHDQNDFDTFDENDILETHPFTADMTHATAHPVVKTIVSFLSERGIHPTTTSTLKKKIMPTTNKRINGPNNSNNNDQTPNLVPIIVSLSGGVDSMVIAHVLSFLRNECNYQHLHLVAVHVDYGNRPESAAEAAYVKHYSEQMLGFQGGCPIQRIENVTRGVTARDEYEKVSRTVRYDLYRNTIKQCLSLSTSPSSSPTTIEVGVMLGHHRGDLRENVLSNAHKGCGPLDLSGMTKFGYNDGVAIYRPLLPLEKIQVYDYAHKYGVPYFKDTTPRWSTRGKLRNKLLPLLEEIYGDGSMSNLSSLAEESDEARALLNESILKPFMDEVTYYPMGIAFHTAPFKHQGPYFWKLAIRDVLHSAGRGMFSDKSVTAFLERAVAEKVRPGWLQCRKDYAVHLLENGKVYIFHPESFPWRNSDQYDIFDEAVQYGIEHSVNIGPWIICSELMQSISEETATELIEKKAFESMDVLMTGSIEYYLQVPLISSNDKNTSKHDAYPLIVIHEFTKQNRPACLKNTDMKVQNTLPLLGNGKDAVSHLKTEDELVYGENWLVAKVTLKLASTLDAEAQNANKDCGNGNRDATVSLDQVEATVKENDVCIEDNVGTQCKELNGLNGKDDSDKVSNLWEALIQPFVQDVEHRR